VPTYDYQCRACGTVTEVIHSMVEDGPTTCERCGGQLRRVLFPTGIIFKGSGFYRNDSRKVASGSGGGASGEAAGSSGAEPGSKSDGKSGSAASEGGGATGDAGAKAPTAGGDS
jgi:putative FmdB family regulatory protein